MGNNEAFSHFEATVIAVYNKGVLDKELLSTLMNQYRGMDIDTGGMAGTLSKKDKLDVIEIILKTFGVELPPRPKLPKNYLKWTKAQSKANDDWNDAYSDAYYKIRRKFGWE